MPAQNFTREGADRPRSSQLTAFFMEMSLSVAEEQEFARLLDGQHEDPEEEDPGPVAAKAKAKAKGKSRSRAPKAPKLP